MKKLLVMSCLALVAGAATAQQTEGRIVYERTVQMQIRVDGPGSEGVEHTVPRTATDKFEVLFGNNQSIRRQIAEETPDETQLNGDDMGVTVMLGGTEEVTYHNFSEKKRVEKREFAGKQYLVTDTIEKINWKLTGETKTILGQQCQQAIGESIFTRMMLRLVNGETKHQPVTDTMNITAWFAPAIPVAAGPEYQGQLPGLIMAIDIDNGRMVYRAIELLPKADVAGIKEPKGGKKVTEEQFTVERDKALKELERNNRGPNRKVLRIGG